MPIHNFLLFQDNYGTEEMRQIWTEKNMVQKWLDCENAMVQEMAALGLIPQNVAEDINQCSSVENVSPADILEYLKTTKHIGVSLVKAFNSKCPTSGEHYHLGLTTQDILLTGLTLQMKQAYQLIMQQLLDLEEILLEQALRYQNTVMMGRTHAQHAIPLTLGFTIASWLYEIRDHIDRLQELSKRLFLAKYTATVGTRSTWVFLFGLEKTQQLVAGAAQRIGLDNPPIDIQTRTDRIAEIGFVLANIVTSLGKIGLNIRHLSSEEIREIEEPWDFQNQYSSSTMPNKRNPESSEWLDGLAKVAQGNAAALLSITVLNERDATRMAPKFKCIADNFLLASVAIKKTSFIMKGLQVNDAVMKKNLYLTNNLAMTEAIMLKLWQKSGKKVTAHELLRNVSMKVVEQNLNFKQVLLAEPSVMQYLTIQEIEDITNPEIYLGDAIEQIHAITSHVKNRRQTKH
jgi:adenylosuccinate lyase